MIFIKSAIYSWNKIVSSKTYDPQTPYTWWSEFSGNEYLHICPIQPGSSDRGWANNRPEHVVSPAHAQA